MADTSLFELKIIKPDGMFYEGECEFLEFTSVEGEMGVYKNHIPLATILESCVMRMHTNGVMKKAAVMGGFIEIQKDHITVLAEDANWPEEIDIERAQAAKKRAQVRLQQKNEEVDVIRAEAALKRSIARINTVK